MITQGTPEPTAPATEAPTDVATPAATDASTATATMTIPDRLYQVSTLAPAGPEMAVIYTASTGEMGIVLLLLIMLILGAFGVFLEMKIARFLKRRDRS
jgi:hypothetical protein